MPAINRTGLTTNRGRILVTFVSLAIFVVVVSLFFFRSQQKVGDYDLNIPGSVATFQDNGTSAGNLKEYIVKGKKTNIHVVLDDTLAYKGAVNLADIKVQRDNFLATQRAASKDGLLKEVTNGTLSLGKIQGYYQFADLTNTRGQSVQQRNIFFLRDGKPYQITFWFTETGLASDNELASKTWHTLLDNLDIPANAFPIAR